MKKLFFLILSTFTLFAYSQVPSHCKQTEFSILNAKMGKMQNDKFIPNEKILSLCADKEKEPFGFMAYRYGKLGSIEIENIATQQSNMFLYAEQTSPKTSDNVIWFKKGNYIYVVNECMGMCQSVSIYVFQNKKKIAELVSPSEFFDSNLFVVDMIKTKSPIFKIKEPDVNWYN